MVQGSIRTEIMNAKARSTGSPKSALKPKASLIRATPEELGPVLWGPGIPACGSESSAV